MKTSIINGSEVSRLSVAIHNALETLFDEALQEFHPDIHEKVMLNLPLDQINFSELNKDEFNLAIKEIERCIQSRTVSLEWQSYQERIWEEKSTSLIQQDERY
ncbi:hypothetical protein A7P61_03895 (plasmid) [Pantoea agglomerans pv. betae]|uniref:hypothetical protein n=1 Tax=Enterobacter agglomerans TaxID=549 RepID=UPI000941D9A0|nr:hypothetical protein [Pantoea agglomerans]WHU82346.1 hypothetical protein A7P61_03895 [Pantoea agglomerans pv. betae]